MGFSLTDVRKAYAAPDGSTLTVLDVPAFAVGDGEQVALVGSSGGGKTTLLHVIAGIVAADSGSVLFGRDEAIARYAPSAAGAGTLAYVSNATDAAAAGVVDVGRLPESQRDAYRGRTLGYIFQTHHLLPGFTALENVLLGMSFGGKRADRAWAEHLLGEVGLKERLHYRPAKLSVGQQQRVAVARALANRPSVVLADEPTGALDYASAGQVLELIRRLATEVNASLLIVTHDRAIAAQMSRSVDLYEINRAATRPQMVGVSA